MDGRGGSEKLDALWCSVTESQTVEVCLCCIREVLESDLLEQFELRHPRCARSHIIFQLTAQISVP